MLSRPGISERACALHRIDSGIGNKRLGAWRCGMSSSPLPSESFQSIVCLFNKSCIELLNWESLRKQSYVQHLPVFLLLNKYYLASEAEYHHPSHP